MTRDTFKAKGQEVEIVVEGGVVVEVNGLPSDWTFHVTDNDCVLEVEDEQRYT